MTTEFEFAPVGAELQKILGGKPLKGTRIYSKSGDLTEFAAWVVAIDDFIEGGFTSPASVPQYVPVSRSAVYKRIKEGRLTAFCFDIVKDGIPFADPSRSENFNPLDAQNVFVPKVEVNAWARQIEERTGRITPMEECWRLDAEQKEKKWAANRESAKKMKVGNKTPTK